MKRFPRHPTCPVCKADLEKDEEYMLELVNVLPNKDFPYFCPVCEEVYQWVDGEWVKI